MGEQVTRIPVEHVRELVRRAKAGAVDFSRRNGVVCPMCGQKLGPGFLHVTVTKPWTGACRERYHRCPVCKWTFKSVESDFCSSQ